MRTLRFKILALAGLLVLVSQSGTIAAVLFAANRDAGIRAEQNLKGAGAATRQLAQGHGNRLRIAGRVLAADPVLRGAIVSGDLVAATTILESQRQQANLDLGMLLDPQGRILAASESIRQQRVSYPGLVNHTNGDGVSRTVIQADGLAYEVVTVPVGEDEPIAWLAMGLLIDKSVAMSISKLTGLDATLLARAGRVQSVLGSSLTDLNPSALLHDLTTTSDRDGAPMEFTTDGIEYVALVLPFIPGYADVEILLSQRLDTAMASFASLRLWILALSSVVLGLAMAGGILLSRTISDPLRALVGAARRISDGDYRQPVNVHADGDVAVLSNALNAMQESIAEREQRILYQTHFDALTGLPTRTSALSRLEAAITDAADRNESVTMMLIDLNNFSEVGSSLGHDIGDALRCQAAERLRAGLDASHMLARLEGDQFLVILERHDLAQAVEIAEDLLRLLGAGLSVRDVNVSIEARVGLAAYPQHADDADQLLKRAAVARNEARSAEIPILAYQPGNEERHIRQLAILADLRRAARHDEFRLFLQPKIRLSDGRICGAEALVRWQHPTFGFLTPDQFIPLAERSGNISLITNWALGAAIRECRFWLEEGLDLPVSVNLSARDLQNRDLPCFALELLRDHDLPSRNLVLEITEQAVVHDSQRAILVLECLRDLGIGISIDDFGTGYSSLAHLKHLPADELKIDRSFVMDLPGNKDDAAIVRAAIDLAHNLGLTVLAEGVETSSALQWLEAHGCEQAQGFLISKPMPAEEFCAWVRRYEKGAAQPGAGLRIVS
ncbi:MAG: EAL domain-containing protein [Gammaproteobacteria bacterium]|nr:EAL domain-containing protein [Gammaproteobacteria bacterium]